MTSSRRLDLTTEARRDYRSILRYTRKIWGERQRDLYARRLTDSMQELTRFPNLGQARDDLALGLRSRPVGEHVIFYRVDDEAITITRILHTRMDAAARFAE